MAWSAVPSTTSRNRSSLARNSAVRSSTCRPGPERKAVGRLVIDQQHLHLGWPTHGGHADLLPHAAAWGVPCPSGLHQQSVVYLLHGPVTGTGGGFQPLPVENRELPPTVADEA